jgi:hypothetical protein
MKKYLQAETHCPLKHHALSNIIGYEGFFCSSPSSSSPFLFQGGRRSALPITSNHFQVTDPDLRILLAAVPVLVWLRWNNTVWPYVPPRRGLQPPRHRKEVTPAVGPDRPSSTALSTSVGTRARCNLKAACDARPIRATGTRNVDRPLRLRRVHILLRPIRVNCFMRAQGRTH